MPLGDSASGETGPGSSSIKAYLDLLYREIALAPRSETLSTIYIGGGTPSLLAPSQIAKILDNLRLHFGFQSGAEITLEIDPASFDQISLQGYIDAGVNRVSLGAQSFDDKTLLQLGRRHNYKELIEACEWIGESFRRGNLFSWSLDLIQNLPHQNQLFWQSQLLEALSVSPPHISVYDLSIEEGTVFAWRANRGELSLPKENVAADISAITCKTLSQAGFSRYEISNHALPGHTSRHNRAYWSGGGWWGFGQGATSCPWGQRLTRPRTRDGYAKWLEVQENDGLDSSLISANDEQGIPMDDRLIVGLRRREGINLKLLSQSFNWDENQLETNMNSLIERWKGFLEMGLVKQKGYRFVLTNPNGMEISNQIIVEMLLWFESLD